MEEGLAVVFKDTFNYSFIDKGDLTSFKTLMFKIDCASPIPSSVYYQK